MKKIHFIEAGRVYGEYRALREVMHTVKKSGLVEKRWECLNILTNEVKTHRARFLTKRIPYNEVLIRKQELINDKVVNNQHQMGVRKRYYREYRDNAIKRGINFNLSFEEFNEVIIKDCFYCGDEPTESERWAKTEHKEQPKLKYNGVDRITSTLGYSTGNIVPCCIKCNLMKHVFEANDFIKHCQKVADYNRSSTTILSGSTTQANGVGNGVSLI
jgi:hypothetical protein